MANDTVTPVPAGQSPWAIQPLPGVGAQPQAQVSGASPWAIPPLPGVTAQAQTPTQTTTTADAATLPASYQNSTPPAAMTWEANPSAPLNVEGGHLKRGKSGEEVATLQRALSAAGFPVEANGRFGPETDAAVRAFQAQMGLKVDGIAGPHTKSALEALRKGAMAQQAMGVNMPDAATKAQASHQAAANHLARIPADQASPLRERLSQQAQSMGQTFPQPDASATYPPASETRRRGRTGALPADASNATPTQNTPATTDPTGNAKADAFIAAARQFLGQPYRWGGGHGAQMSRPGPVDCSGLVQQAARMAGMNLDGTARVQQRMGSPTSLNNLKPGDLLFRGNPATHVGIYLGNGQFMHAPRTGDVVKVQSMSTYRWTSARRVF